MAPTVLVPVLAALLAGGGPAFELEAARAAVRPLDVASDVRFLCADDLGGRPTPSRELDLAARYLVARAQRLGLEPGCAEGHLHAYELTRRRLDARRSGLEVDGPGGAARLTFPDDWVLHRREQLVDGERSGPLVAWTDRDDGDLSGRFVLVVDPGRSVLRPLRRAAELGAVGALVARDPAGGGRPYAERFATLAETLERGWIESPFGRRTRGADELPTVHLTGRGLARLLAVGGGTLADPGPVTVRELRSAVEAVRAENVVALHPGRGRARECVVVCAHFDHVGRLRGALHPGADDNASGAAALLAVGAGLRAGGALERSVLLAWFSGEENGFWGAAAWAADPRLPAGLVPVAAINLDMVGRTDPAALYLTPTAEHDAWNTVAAALGAAALHEGFEPVRGQDEYWTRSDHYRLHTDLGIPVAYLSSGDHDDYHMPTDTPEKLDPDKAARVARTVLRALAALDRADFGQEER